MLLLNISNIAPEQEFSLQRNGIHFNLKANEKLSWGYTHDREGWASFLCSLIHPSVSAAFTLRLRSVHTLRASPGLPMKLKESSSWERGRFTKAPANYCTLFNQNPTIVPKPLVVSLVYCWQGKLSGWWQEGGLLCTLAWPDQAAQLAFLYARQH